MFLRDMISNISHQLKTPLAALNMYMEIIKDEPENEETVKIFSQKSMKSLERMERLIQSLLKMARLDTGNIVFEKRECFAFRDYGCERVAAETAAGSFALGDRAFADLLASGDGEAHERLCQGKIRGCAAGQPGCDVYGVGAVE